MTRVRKLQKPQFDYSANEDDIFVNEEIEARKASQIDDKPQTWLWENFIPLKTSTLIAGVPGIGKSQFLTWLASVVSKGETFKLNSIDYNIEKGSVLFIACEDHAETGIVPRLKALKADLEKIYIIKSVARKEAETKKKRLLAIDVDIDLLRDKIKEIGDVKLIIIDPVSGFIGKTRDHVDSEVRNLLSGLNDLADESNLSVVINKHQRKKGSGQGINSAIDEVAGSGAWVNFPRQSFIIAEHPEDPEQILLANLKVNINKKNREAYCYKIQDCQYTNKDNELIKTSHIIWQNYIVKLTATEALSKDAYELSKKANAITFIESYLEDRGQSRAEDILNAALESGIKKDTFYAAKNNINIQESNGRDGKKYWMLSKD